ncbi:hypothetical protein L1887_48773 [Cichorium endivia]|nr:hypothetical protein L1887_48773 [Cichorium endivia]
MDRCDADDKRPSSEGVKEGTSRFQKWERLGRAKSGTSVGRPTTGEPLRWRSGSQDLGSRPAYLCERERCSGIRAISAIPGGGAGERVGLACGERAWQMHLQPLQNWLGWVGLGWAGLGWAGLGWAGLALVVGSKSKGVRVMERAASAHR